MSTDLYERARQQAIGDCFDCDAERILFDDDRCWPCRRRFLALPSWRQHVEEYLRLAEYGTIEEIAQRAGLDATRTYAALHRARTEGDHRVPEQHRPGWMAPLDEIAVERAASGERVKLTQAERIEVIRLMAGRHHTDRSIAEVTGWAFKSVAKIRSRHGIPAGVPCSRRDGAR